MKIAVGPSRAAEVTVGGMVAVTRKCFTQSRAKNGLAVVAGARAAWVAAAVAVVAAAVALSVTKAVLWAKSQGERAWLSP